MHIKFLLLLAATVAAAIPEGCTPDEISQLQKCSKKLVDMLTKEYNFKEHKVLRRFYYQCDRSRECFDIVTCGKEVRAIAESTLQLKDVWTDELKDCARRIKEDPLTCKAGVIMIHKKDFDITNIATQLTQSVCDGILGENPCLRSSINRHCGEESWDFLLNQTQQYYKYLDCDQ